MIFIALVLLNAIAIAIYNEIRYFGFYVEGENKMKVNKTELTKEIEECIVADIRQKHSGKKLTPKFEDTLSKYVLKSLESVRIDLQNDKRLVSVFVKQVGKPK